LVDSNETKREIWKIDWEVEFMLDTWPWLNPFLEIEIEWESEEIVQKYTKLLDFNYDDWLFWSVDEVYLKELWIEKEIINNLSEITFDNVPRIKIN
jgi:succinate dehydrogenase flavin-adding protein (antitoxin of CptAB toxin-antitoxin module)